MGQARGDDLHFYALLLGGICACLSCLVSAFTITAHMIQTRRHQLRNYTIRILLMVLWPRIQPLPVLALFTVSSTHRSPYMPWKPTSLFW